MHGQNNQLFTVLTCPVHGPTYFQRAIIRSVSCLPFWVGRDNLFHSWRGEIYNVQDLFFKGCVVWGRWNKLGVQDDERLAHFRMVCGRLKSLIAVSTTILQMPNSLAIMMHCYICTFQDSLNFIFKSSSAVLYVLHKSQTYFNTFE